MLPVIPGEVGAQCLQFVHPAGEVQIPLRNLVGPYPVWRPRHRGPGRSGQQRAADRGIRLRLDARRPAIARGTGHSRVFRRLLGQPGGLPQAAELGDVTTQVLDD